MYLRYSGDDLSTVKGSIYWLEEKSKGNLDRIIWNEVVGCDSPLLSQVLILILKIWDFEYIANFENEIFVRREKCNTSNQNK